MTEPSQDNVTQLHIDCVRSLRSYMAEANLTCKLLTHVAKFPVSSDERLRILEQRRRENIAFEHYRDARRRFDAASWEDSQP